MVPINNWEKTHRSLYLSKFTTVSPHLPVYLSLIRLHHTHSHTHTHTLKKRANSSQRLFLWKQSYKVWVLCIGKIANVLLLLLACNLLLRLLVPSFSRMVPVALWVAAEGHSLPRVACSPSLSENRCQMHVFLQNTCAHGPPETREGVLRTSFCKLPSLQGM